MAFKVNNIIKLSNGRIFNLLEDDLTTQDYRELSGVEVRELREKQLVTGTGAWVYPDACPRDYFPQLSESKNQKWTFQSFVFIMSLLCHHKRFGF